MNAVPSDAHMVVRGGRCYTTAPAKVIGVKTLLGALAEVLDTAQTIPVGFIGVWNRSAGVIDWRAIPAAAAEQEEFLDAIIDSNPATIPVDTDCTPPAQAEQWFFLSPPE